MVVVSLITLNSTFAQDETQKISEREKDFLMQSAMMMVMYKRMLEVCSSNIMPGDEKMEGIQKSWFEQYWPTGLELVHYMAHYIVSRDGGDLAQVKEQLYEMGNESIAAINSESKRKQKKICKDLQKNSIKDSREAHWIYKSIEQKTLIEAFGPYDGQAEYDRAKIDGKRMSYEKLKGRE